MIRQWKVIILKYQVQHSSQDAYPTIWKAYDDNNNKSTSFPLSEIASGRAST